MPVQRQDIGAEVGPGNFGSRGTPLGLTPFRKGPDLGRLMNSLGLLAQTGKQAIQDDQAEDTRAAELEINEAMVRNLDKPQQMQDEIDAIRNKYKDPGFLAETFGLGNPALQAVDDIVARDKMSIETVRSIGNLHSDMKGRAPEEIAGATNELLQKQFDQMQDMTPESRLEFLKRVNPYARDMYEKSKNDYRIAQEELQKKEINSTGYEESITGIETWTGKNIDQVRDSAKEWEEYDVNYGLNRDKIHAKVFKDMRNVYERILGSTKGDTIVAAEHAWQHLSTIAQDSGRPDLLELGKAELSRNGDGRSLSGLYAKEIASLKNKLEVDKANMLIRFGKQEEQRIEGANTANLDTLRANLADMTTAIENSTGQQQADLRDEFIIHARKSLKQLSDDRYKGKYEGNDALYDKQNFEIRSALAKVIRERGDSRVEAEFKTKLASGALTHSDLIRMMPKLGPSVRPQAKIKLEKLERLNVAREEKFRDFEDLEWMKTSRSEFDWRAEDYNALMNSREGKVLEPKDMPPGTAFLLKDYKKDYDEALIRANLEFANNLEEYGKDGRTTAPPELIRKHTEHLNQRFDKRFEELRKAMGSVRLKKPDGTLGAPVGRTELPSETRAEAPARRQSKRIQEFSEEPSAKNPITITDETAQRQVDEDLRVQSVINQVEQRGITDRLTSGFKFEDPVNDISTIYKAVNEGRPISHKVIAHAVTAELQENTQALVASDGYLKSPSDILNHVFSRMAFDLSRPKNVEQLAQILESGLSEYAIRPGGINQGGGFDTDRASDVLSTAIKENKLSSLQDIKKFVNLWTFEEEKDQAGGSAEGKMLHDKLVQAEALRIIEIIKKNQSRFNKR